MSEIKELKLEGIWDNEYVRILGILDHCHEVIKLYDEIRVQKPISSSFLNVTEKNNIEFPNVLELIINQFNKELMDLYLILDKHFQGTIILKEDRLKKFKEKSEENKPVEWNNPTADIDKDKIILKTVKIEPPTKVIEFCTKKGMLFFELEKEYLDICEAGFLGDIEDFIDYCNGNR